MNTDSLTITPSLGATVVSATDAAKATRDALLIEAAGVTTITDRLDADAAVSVLRGLKDFLKTIEAQREAAKAPALDVGRRIDALAKELVAAVKNEEARIARICGAFEAEERRKADDARIAAQNEAARIAYEAAQKEREAQRTMKPEAAARASDDIAAKAQTQIAAVRAAAAPAPRTENTQVRSTVLFEVTDMNALHAAHPELVVLEPNGTAIRAILNANPNLKVPGLRHWKEQKLNVR